MGLMFYVGASLISLGYRVGYDVGSLWRRYQGVDNLGYEEEDGSDGEEEDGSDGEES